MRQHDVLLIPINSLGICAAYIKIFAEVLAMYFIKLHGYIEYNTS